MIFWFLQKIQKKLNNKKLKIMENIKMNIFSCTNFINILNPHFKYKIVSFDFYVKLTFGCFEKFYFFDLLRSSSIFQVSRNLKSFKKITISEDYKLISLSNNTIENIYIRCLLALFVLFKFIRVHICYIFVDLASIDLLIHV